MNTSAEEKLREIAQQLVAAREAQGMPLEEVATKTFIPIRTLKALEAAETFKLPEPIFVQGFIKRYAKLVGLDGDALSKQIPLDQTVIQQKCDPHGGYIFDDRADFTKWAIYGLAGLGWQGFVKNLDTDPKFQEALDTVVKTRSDLTVDQQRKVACLFILSHQCDEKGVQMLLSPERYQVDLMGEMLDRSAY